MARKTSRKGPAGEGPKRSHLFGAHMSIAGGYYRAVEQARSCDCDCVQIFTKNSNQWRAKPIEDKEVERFQAALREHQIQFPTAHTSYLINLAAPDDDLWRQSIDAMVVELLRSDQLGLGLLVVHPGAYTTSSEALGLQRIVEALDEIERQTPDARCQILLETTAGQGSCLGWRFEHLAEILGRVRNPERLDVCFDTCHVFAAGYDITTPSAYKKTMEQFDQTIGLGRIRAFHLNDSKRPLGSRVDRHEHIGRGEIGLEGFRLLVNDPRFAGIPMYLETPKGTYRRQAWDTINLRTLRKLVAS